MDIEIKIPQSRLLKHVARLGKVTDNVTFLPALQGVLLNVRDNRLVATASNGNFTLRETVVASAECTITGTGDILVPGKLLTNVVRSCTGVVHITVQDDKHAHVWSDTTKAKLNLMEVRDYPDIDMTAEDSQTITLPREQLTFLVTSTAFAASENDKRVALQGVNLRVGQRTVDNVDDAVAQTIEACATDSYRAGWATVNLPGDYDFNVTVFAVDLKKLMELTGNTDQVTIQVGESKLAVDNGTTKIALQYVDAKFPDVKNLIPQTFEHIAVIERAKFDQLINRVIFLTSESSRAGDLTLTPQRLQLKVTNSQMGVVEAHTTADYTGADFTLTCNFLFLKQALNALTDEYVVIGLNGDQQPFTVRGRDLKDTYQVDQVILPHRRF